MFRHRDTQGALALLAALVLMASCTSLDCRDVDFALQPAPWYGGAIRSKLELCIESRFASETKDTHYRWRNGLGGTVRYTDLGPQLHAFLERDSLSRKPHQLLGEWPDPPFCYWTRHNAWRGFEFYSPAWVIVAFRPLVLIRVPREIVALGEPTGNFDRDDGGIIFPDGVLCSTRLPLLDEVIWISPDLDVGPREAARMADGSWEIPVPWGRLEVRPVADAMMVEAVEALHGASHR